MTKQTTKNPANDNWPCCAPCKYFKPYIGENFYGTCAASNEDWMHTRHDAPCQWHAPIGSRP